MAEGIVVLFEEIYIEHDQADHFFLEVSTVDEFFQGLKEVTVVICAR